MAAAGGANSTAASHSTSRYPWLWDVAMSNEDFDALLQGAPARGAFDSAWAMARLIEYAPWSVIKHTLPREHFLAHWPAARRQVRSAACREGMDFLYDYWRQRN